MPMNSGQNETLSQNQNNGHSNLNSLHNVTRQGVSSSSGSVSNLENGSNICPSLGCYENERDGVSSG